MDTDAPAPPPSSGQSPSGTARRSQALKGDLALDTGIHWGYALLPFHCLGGPEREFVENLSALGVPIVVASPSSNGAEFARPSGWQKASCSGNAVRLAASKPGYALLGVLGGQVAVLDIDTKNGARVEQVLAALEGLDIRVYADVVTPSGGRHYYVAGHEYLPAVAATAGRPGLVGFPGVEVLSFGRNAFLPGTLRPKYDGRGYTILRDELATLADGDEASAEALVGWVTAHRVTHEKPFTSGPVWDGTAPNKRQRKYLHAALANTCARLAAMGPNSGRNNALFHAALGMGNLIAGAGLDENEVIKTLRRAAKSNGLLQEDGQRNVDATIRSGLLNGKQRPRPVPEDDPAKELGFSTAPASGGMKKAKKRAKPSLCVTSTAVTVDWARREVGIGASADIFRRGDALVRVPELSDSDYARSRREGDDDGPAKVLPLVRPGQFAAAMSVRYELYARDKNGNQHPALFPIQAARECLDAVEAMQGVRPLQGVTHVPTLRADGTVLDTPGYDDATRLAYMPDQGLYIPPVPAVPSPQQVRESVDLLLWLVQDFTFVTEHDRANYLGALLTPLVRAVAHPPHKLYAITAPMPGSGKTLLADIMRLLHGAVLRGEMPQGEELKKELTTVLATTTAPVVVFDNVSGRLDSSTLAALLTSDRYEARLLGVNEQVSVPNDRLWTITGNNVAIGGDLPRRTFTTSIDPGIPNPHKRTKFVCPDLLGYVKAHRGEILSALLVLARSWYASGRPMPAGQPDHFGVWRRTVDGILTHAGVPGHFDDVSTDLEPVGSEDAEWGDFLAAVERVFGTEKWTVRELLSKLDTSTYFGSSPNLPLKIDDLPHELADGLRGSSSGPRTISRSLGYWLRNRKGRWVGELCVRQDGQDRDKNAQWRIDRVKRASAEAGSR